MKKIFSVGEIAKILNVARSTVIYWIKDGRIKANQTPGGKNLIQRDDLISFMNTVAVLTIRLKTTLPIGEEIDQLCKKKQ